LTWHTILSNTFISGKVDWLIGWIQREQMLEPLEVEQHSLEYRDRSHTNSSTFFMMEASTWARSFSMSKSEMMMPQLSQFNHLHNNGQPF